LLVGCEGGDPTGSASLSEAEAEVLFQEVADNGRVRLPSATNLFHQVRAALRLGAGVNPGVQALLDEQEAVRHAAREALEDGDVEGSRLLVEQARQLQFEVIVAVLGAEVAERTVASVEMALSSVRERIEGKWIPRPIMARLDSLSEIVSNARASLTDGDPAAALALALRAAEGLRGLSPEAFSVRAEAAIVRATTALDGAFTLVGQVGVDPRALEALERAALFLDRAHRSLENGAYAAALELAQTSTQHSSRAIQLSRRGVDPVS
jgi:HEPN domain-containing protein